ncbi:protoheme IX farnesyltransferase, mitochondrial isoform X2 [Lepeophtheirus salmonis]|uniref:protoheme IX farnesyltransferase, mitochondrial isoform X2 n=1 Tax=Lepeophtheirus salmonis TaxID=72036 RepID=UPI001AE92DBE|nr:protoheme IX farnesyltransferase, mitochondrial-like isoform X2 [Lepeophtheirus salmonis]
MLPHFKVIRHGALRIIRRQSTKPLQFDKPKIKTQVGLNSNPMRDEEKSIQNKISTKPVVNSIFTDEESISSSSSSGFYDPVDIKASKDKHLPSVIKSPPLSQLPSLYSQLSKSRLTFLVCLTSSTGYILAPGAFDLTTFAAVTLGTWSMSCSANTINQILEVPYDSQMNRTKNRVLVRGLISSFHAAGFALTTAAAGTCLLYFGANGTAAILGLATWTLYTWVYTTMKRSTIYNTWVGSIVGAIPPLIGWAGSSGSLAPGALIAAGILYSWQFPHFNALSWNLRPDYSKAGYRMMSVLEPDLCLKVSLRHSIALIGICSAAPLLDLTDWTFAVDSLPLNIYLSILAYKFYQNSDSASSRKLFHFTLIHLPLLLTLLVLGKKSKELSENKKPSEMEKNINATIK